MWEIALIDFKKEIMTLNKENSKVPWRAKFSIVIDLYAEAPQLFTEESRQLLENVL